MVTGVKSLGSDSVTEPEHKEEDEPNFYGSVPGLGPVQVGPTCLPKPICQDRSRSGQVQVDLTRGEEAQKQSPQGIADVSRSYGQRQFDQIKG